MGKDSRDVCRHKMEPGSARKHDIIPEVFTELCGISDSGSVILCVNCYKEVHDWYLRRVYNLTYDYETKRFKYKSPKEMVKEYQSAFRSFVKYKSKRTQEN